MQPVVKQNFMVIDFSVTGAAEAMHRDKFSLGFLGKQHITRASDIRHNDETQLWDIHLADGDNFIPVAEARGFESYDEARAMEVKWLEMSRLHAVSPTSTEGINILNALRLQDQ